jgi:hypothetical protein
MIVPIAPIKSAKRNKFFREILFINGPDIKQPINAPKGIDANV